MRNCLETWPPRARRPWPVLCWKTHHARIANPVWEHARKAAARAAALAHYVSENTPCAKGQGRGARGGPGPSCAGTRAMRGCQAAVRAAALAHSDGKHTMRKRPGPPRARRPWPTLCGKFTMRGGKAAARVAALAHSVLENTPCAKGEGRRARGGPGQCCVGKCTMRGGKAAARAAALANSVLESTPCAKGQGRRARGGPGPPCVGKCTVRGGEAAARAAALARSVLENTPCANCQSSVGTCAKSRRAGCGPCPLCVGKHTVREGPGPRRARRPWPILCGNTRNAWVPGRRARGGPGPF